MARPKTGGRKSGVLFIVGAVVAAGITVFGILNVVQTENEEIEAAKQPPDPVPVVVAVQTLEMGVMIDKDGRFRLYLRQSGWQTVTAETPPKPGHWHQVGVVVTPQRAELWINGKREGVGALKQPLPQTAAQSLSVATSQPNGQQPSPVTQASIEVVVQVRSQVSASPEPVFTVQASPSSQGLGGKTQAPVAGSQNPSTHGSPVSQLGARVTSSTQT